jgi:septation ring formation regulator EzrA
VTGLSMRTLFEAHEQTILVAEGIANIRGSRASIMTAGDPLAMIFQKLTRRRFRFGDALLAKIDAAEAQMKADAERIAELEGDLEQLREDERSAWDTSEAWRKRCAKAARAIEGLD